MSRRAVRLLGVALFILAATATLVPLWWWALFGMSQSVGIAWYVTVNLLFFGGFVLVTMPLDGDQ